MDRGWKIEAVDPGAAADRVEALADRLAEEMAAAWDRGERPLAEDFFTRHPELCARPRAGVRLVYEEFCLRQEAGLEVSSAELARRFPRWREELADLLDCHRLLEPSPGRPDFPRAGETLEGFRLVAELGRGALGRVFLAVQPALADRPVVLKLAPREGREHLSLARLQHTHVVPLYSVHDLPDRGVQALCMPYLGGATLAHLLEALRDRPPRRRTGRDLLEALDGVGVGVPVALPATGRERQFLASASYVRAICWMGAGLADALQYAHDRGLVHLDVKPSNVLVAADGQPLLLDFHLARHPISSGGPPTRWLGGSPAYMSPEQELALAAIREGRPAPVAVDGRSDVYSLGLVLHEALGGTLPIPRESPPPRLSRCNPRVSPGLSGIVRKCLERDPRDRYPNAAALATDLRQHLADLPLKGVPNRSPAERWRKWRRRRPHALALVGMLLAVLGAASIVGYLALSRVGERLHEARSALAASREQLQQQRYSEAVATLVRGLAVSEGLPGGRDLTQEFGLRLRAARRGEAAQRLHLIAERLRFLDGIESLPRAALRDIEAGCRTIWEGRGRLIDRTAGAGLEPELERRIQADLLDLAILWADLRVRRAPGGESDGARHEALRILAEAEAVLAPSPILYRERRAHAEALGLTSLAHAAARRSAEFPAQTAWEHYALGRSLLRSGELEPAAAEFERALELRPQGFWPNFYQGICCYRLRRYADAVSAFSACVALAPGSAEAFHNRALAYAALGQAERALRDYDRAVQLDSGLSAAALNRGVLHYQGKRYDQAVADLKRALDAGADPAVVHYNLALVALSRGERRAAESSLRLVLQHHPEHREARILYDRLRRE